MVQAIVGGIVIGGMLLAEWRLRDVYQLERWNEDHQLWVPMGATARGIHWARMLAWCYHARITRYGKVI